MIRKTQYNKIEDCKVLHKIAFSSKIHSNSKLTFSLLSLATKIKKMKALINKIYPKIQQL